MQAEIPQAFYNIYVMNTLYIPGSHLGPFAIDIYIYATDHKRNYVFRKLQRDVSAIETWCERWNIRISEDNFGKFSHRLRYFEVHLSLN